MKRKAVIIVALCISAAMSAQRQNASYLAYIAQWKNTAVQQQEDYGVPAAITMAQALLESGAGQSELAVNANNHFGIKCTNEWFGAVYYYDDDSKGECFRQYNDATESFKDHSLFLQRPRYMTCFEIAVEDYEGWAHRLKACGYATDPSYASKLIKIIEDYRLDTLAAGGVVPVTAATSAPIAIAGGVSQKGKASLQEQKRDSIQAKQKRPLKAEVVHRTEPIMVIHNDPEPPYVAPLTAKEERDSFMLMHPSSKCNGVTYVNAREEDTYANVAFRLNVRERALREYNDALGRELKKGDRIYLYAKKKAGEREYVWTYPGQSLWELSQEEGVAIDAIRKLNGLDPSVRTFHIRQRLYLRKVKEENASH